ncbi:hypothetical protein ACNKHS_14845 [Shigella flexneri]
MKDKPSLIISRTAIGFGSPNKAGKEEAHGTALGEGSGAAPAETRLAPSALWDPKGDLPRLGCLVKR